MTEYFFDTSALAKRYINEDGSNAVRDIVRQDTFIFISTLTTVEMRSLLYRRLNMGSLKLARVARIDAAFQAHLRHRYAVVNFSDSMSQEAIRIVRTYQLRTLDALQLASALEAQRRLQLPLTFVAADVKLLAAAQAETFSTFSPLEQ